MSKSKKPSKVPSPKERPEIYDGYDFPPGKPVLSESYRERTTPASIKARRASRNRSAA